LLTRHFLLSFLRKAEGDARKAQELAETLATEKQEVESKLLTMQEGGRGLQNDLDSLETENLNLSVQLVASRGVVVQRTADISIIQEVHQKIVESLNEKLVSEDARASKADISKKLTLNRCKELADKLMLKESETHTLRATLEKQLFDLKTKLTKAAEAEEQHVQDSVEAQLRRQLESSAAERDKKQDENDQHLKAYIDKYQFEIKTLENKLSKSSKLLLSAEHDNEQLQRESSSCRQQLDSSNTFLEANLAEARGKLRKAQQDAQQAVESASSLQTEKWQWQALRHELEKNKTELITTLEKELQENVRKESRWDKVEKQAAQEKSRAESAEANVKMLLSKLQHAAENAVHTQVQMAELEQKLSELGAELQKTEEDNVELRRDIEQQESEHAERCRELVERVSAAGDVAGKAELSVCDMKQILRQKRELLRHNDDERHELVHQLARERQRADAATAVADTNVLNAQVLLHGLSEKTSSVEEQVVEILEHLCTVSRRVENNLDALAGHVRKGYADSLQAQNRMQGKQLAAATHSALQQQIERADGMFRDLKVEEEVGGRGVQESQIIALESEVQNLIDKVMTLESEKQVSDQLLETLGCERMADKAALDERRQQLAQETCRSGEAESTLHHEQAEAESTRVFITELQLKVSVLRSALAASEQMVVQLRGEKEAVGVQKEKEAGEREAAVAAVERMSLQIDFLRESVVHVSQNLGAKLGQVLAAVARAKENDTMRSVALGMQRASDQKQTAERKGEGQGEREGDGTGVSKVATVRDQHLHDVEEYMACENESFQMQRHDLSDQHRKLKLEKEEECQKLREQLMHAMDISKRMAIADSSGKTAHTELRKQLTRERERAERAEADLSRAHELQRVMADKTAAADSRREKEREQQRQRILELEELQSQRSTNILADLADKLTKSESELQVYL